MVDDYKDRLTKAMGKAVTVQQLAAELHLSYQAVKKVVDNKTGSFNAENNAKAAKFLGVRSDWLATGEEPMRDDPTANGWPYVLFSPEEFMLLSEQYRQENENTLAGAIQRVKQTKMPAAA